MAVGVPTCPNCGEMVWPNSPVAVAEQTWRCPNCLASGTVSTLASDTDGTLAANSDSNVASQKATKTYVDTAVAAVGFDLAQSIAFGG